MVEDAQRLDRVRDRDAPVADQEQILAVLLVGGNGEIVGAEIDARGRLVEVDHHELVVHAVAAAAGRLLVERRGHVLVERRANTGAMLPFGICRSMPPTFLSEMP